MLLFRGTTVFDGNAATHAAGSGGALALGLSGSATVRGVARFANNRAGLFGGAAFLADGSASHRASEADGLHRMSCGAASSVLIIVSA